MYSTTIACIVIKYQEKQKRALLLIKLLWLAVSAPYNRKLYAICITHEISFQVYELIRLNQIHEKNVF